MFFLARFIFCMEPPSLRQFSFLLRKVVLRHPYRDAWLLHRVAELWTIRSNIETFIFVRDKLVHYNYQSTQPWKKAGSKMVAEKNCRH